MTTDEFYGLVEAYLKNVGVNSHDIISKPMIDSILKEIMLDFAKQSGVQESKYTISWAANTKEYSIPDEVMAIKKNGGVWLDGTEVYELQDGADALRMAEDN